MPKEYDFLTWTSFPSSFKIINPASDRETMVWHGVVRDLAVNPDLPVLVEVNIKNQNLIWHSFVHIAGWDETLKKYVHKTSSPVTGPGTKPWTHYRGGYFAPIGSRMIAISLVGRGGTSPETPGITWFDDLRVFQDDKLIYANDFSNWNPYIGAGAGGVGVAVPTYMYTKDVPLAVGAGVVGTLIGTAIGYFIST